MRPTRERALIGDAGISLWMTTSVGRFGSRRVLIIGAVLMLLDSE
jgi:hypothetical protein